MSRIHRRLGGFAFLQFVGLLAPFLILPIIARVGGLGGWSSIAVGQSLGAFLSGVVSYGWNLVGPAKIASIPHTERQDIYAASLANRLIVALLVVPGGALIAGMLSAETHKGVGALAAVAGALGGLSIAWFAIGTGKPMLIFYSELLPRLAAVAGAAVLLLGGMNLVVYPLLLIGSSILGTVIVSVLVLKDWSPHWLIFIQGIRELRSQGQGAFTTVLAGAYGSMPTAILGGVSSTASVAAFAAGDKLYRAALFSVVSFGNAFQGWVAEPTGHGARWRRMRVSLTALTSLGLAGGCAIAFLGPWATSVVFGEELAASQQVCAAFGVAFLAVCVTTTLGRHVLVPFGHLRLVMLSTSLGAVCGIPAIALLGLWHGADGGALGFAFGEIVVMTVQSVCVLWMYRRIRPD